MGKGFRSERINKVRLLGILLVAVLFLQGCGRGIIYTHTIRPLDLDMARTPNDPDKGKGDIKHFRYYLVDIQWNSNAIGDIAKREGIETIQYADIEVLSVLGMWNQYWVHIYGR